MAPCDGNFWRPKGCPYTGPAIWMLGAFIVVSVNNIRIGDTMTLMWRHCDDLFNYELHRRGSKLVWSFGLYILSLQKDYAMKKDYAME